MPQSSYVRAVLITAIVLATNASAAVAADQPLVDWLRGSGRDLQLCLQGEVFDSDGQPANDLRLTAKMKTNVSGEQLKPLIDGHRFKLWIPVNQPHWFSLCLRATSANGDHVACEALNMYDLRQAAINGIRLTLQTPTRHVNVRVIDQGQPVSRAIVKAEPGFGIELRSTTNAEGIARFDLLSQQKLSALTAWTDDHRIGGFQFDRTPPHDPECHDHIIELNKCRDQRLRFVAEDGSPVSGVTFAIQVATPRPDYNYIGSNDHSQMTTDVAGEAVYGWFPDWEKVHFYADINENPWVLDGDPKIVDGVAIFKLKKSKPRKWVTGRVTSAATSTGGFFVSIQSFQGERERYSDIKSVFSNSDGAFAIDVLPDATYCAHVLDAHWVGNIIDLIPYDSTTSKSTPPELIVSAGQPVEVNVTTGPQKRPLTNLSVGFFREHEYTWRENGKQRYGLGGAQWWATTNESGIATTHTLPGKLRAAIYTPRWHAEQTITVVAGKPTAIELHRVIEDKRTVTGRLVMDQGAPGSLKDAEIRIGSVDENYKDQQSFKCGPDGSFSFDTVAASIGLFARTRDGLAAGSIVSNDLAAPIEVRLRPTSIYEGQLLGKDSQPAAGRQLQAVIRVDGEKKNRNSLAVQGFEAMRIEAITDKLGNFTLRGVPTQMKVHLSADATDGSNQSIYLDEVYIEPNESRPRSVSRLERTAAAPVKIPLAERYRSTLRDCALSGYRLLLIVADDRDSVLQFVDKNYASYETNKDVYPFMQIVVSGGKEPLEPADAAFLQERNWPQPQPGHVSAYVLDTSGKELDCQVIDINDDRAAEQVAQFIHQHAPTPHDAEKEWTAAFAEAQRSNRRIWVRVSQRYCGPCFRMTRWLDDQRKVLEKDFVMLKIDDVRDTNGSDVAQRVVRGESFGIPFHAIFDESGTMLIDSNGPLGNIGCPSGFEGKKHVRKMLLQTRQNLTDAEIEQLVDSIGD